MARQEKLGLKHINVGELIQQHKCYDGHDSTLDSHILDEDKLLDLMETLFQESADENVGIVADYHSCELFPERWFDLILVLRAKTDVLYDRLTGRGYNDKKRGENLEAEIMQVVLDEARESYDLEIVQEVQSNTVEDMESNVERCRAWVDQWVVNNSWALFMRFGYIGVIARLIKQMKMCMHRTRLLVKHKIDIAWGE